MYRYFVAFSHRKALAALVVFCSLPGILFARGKRAEKPARSKEVVIRYTEERLNGSVFAHRVDIVNGERKEKWAVNGTFVAEADYEEALLEAEKADRRNERRRVESLRVKEEQELAQQQGFFQASKLAIERKRLQLLLDQVDAEMAKIKDSNLLSFGVFSESTYPDQASFLHFCNETVPRARHCIESSAVDVDELSKFVADFESQPTRLRTLFRATVNNAIEKCDDTKLLKELLEVIV